MLGRFFEPSKGGQFAPPKVGQFDLILQLFHQNKNL
jgi:hypothetical protein